MQDTFFLPTVIFFLWLLKSYFPRALLWVRSASHEGNLVLSPAPSPQASPTTRVAVPSWLPLSPFHPGAIYQRGHFFNTGPFLGYRSVTGLQGASSCFRRTPYQTDGKLLEGVYFLAALATSDPGGKTPSPAAQMVFLALAFPSSVPFPFWWALRTSHLLVLHWPLFCFLFIFQFSIQFSPPGHLAPPLSLSPSLSSGHWACI